MRSNRWLGNCEITRVNEDELVRLLFLQGYDRSAWDNLDEGDILNHSSLGHYATAVAATGAAYLVHLVLRPFLHDGEVIYSIFLAAVILISWLRGLGPALLAWVLGVIAVIFFLQQSQAGFVINSLLEEAGLAAYLIIGLCVPLWQSIHKSRMQARAEEDQQSTRARAEKALRESEEQFRAAFHQSAFGMAQSDIYGRHILVNDRYCQLTGFSREELLGRTFLDITHPDDVQMNRQQFNQLVARETPSYEIEKRYIRKDGTVFWVQVSVSLVFNAGIPRYAIAGVQDISERKRKEHALRFLVDLNAATQRLIAPNEIMETVARMLGEHLDTDRCAYAEVEADEDHFTITGDYTRGVCSIVGRYSMSSFGNEALRLMRAGEAYVVDDVDLDPRITPVLSAYRETQIQAVVCVPLQKAGQFAACMAVHQQVSRHWLQEEIDLIQLVVGRCWESIERARTVRRLQDSEQRLRFVLDSMPQKIFTTTPEGEVDYLNPQWISFAGLPFDKIKKWGHTRLVHPDDLEKNIQAWQFSLKTGTPLQLEHRFRSSDGEYRWHMTRALPVRDACGEITMWIGSNTDIHVVKRAEESVIQRSEQVRRLASLASRLNTTSEVVSIMNIVTEEARALIAAHQSITCFTTDQDGEQAFISASLSDKYEKWKSYSARPKGSCRFKMLCNINAPIRMTRADLEAHFEWAEVRAETDSHPPLRGCLAAPLIKRDGTNIGLILLSDKFEGDFTWDDEAALVQLAQMTSVALENARLVEGLRQADRRKDEFLATLAHELRNPLAPMRNMVEVMKRADNPDASTREAHIVIERQLIHMVRLIDDLLDVSRVNRGKLDLRLEQVELAPVIAQAVDAFKTLVESAGHELRVELPPEPVFLCADPARLIQIFGNLLDNACKYTAPGGKILMIAELEGSEILVIIRDTGIGIPADKLNDIFEMFSQVDRSLERLRAGLGIGLTLVKRLVEMHEGNITAHSSGPNRGSEFIIRLPVLNDTQIVEQLQPEAIEQPQLGRRRILVVDDNRDAAISLATLLQIHGEDTLTAHDGLEALEAAEHFHPDVILLDIGMPKMNGYDVCRRIREQRKNVLIIAVSGWGQEQDRRQSQEAGFDYHIVKPLDFSALTKLLAVNNNVLSEVCPTN